MGLFADRTSSSRMQANQLRLYFSAFAYLMVQTLRRVGLAGTKLARGRSWTLRGKLLKIGAQVRVTTRKVWLSFSESCPYAVLLRTVLARVQAHPLRC
ncbi:MAG: transposase [Truepera sp.]|nr:transposase [Truepera sp.]